MENKASFFKRIEIHFTPSEVRDIRLAYMLAKFGHRAQTRKEVDSEGHALRYFEHLRRVAISLLDEARCYSSELVIAALLHDSLEDTEDISADMIEHCFGLEVTRIVKVLSKCPADGYLDRFHDCVDWRPFAIKACDRLSNLRSLAGTDFAFREKQLTETRTKYVPLFDKMVTLTHDANLVKLHTLKNLITQELFNQEHSLKLDKHSKSV